MAMPSAMAPTMPSTITARFIGGCLNCWLGTSSSASANRIGGRRTARLRCGGSSRRRRGDLLRGRRCRLAARHPLLDERRRLIIRIGLEAELFEDFDHAPLELARRVRALRGVFVQRPRARARRAPCRPRDSRGSAAVMSFVGSTRCPVSSRYTSAPNAYTSVSRSGHVAALELGRDGVAAGVAESERAGRAADEVRRVEHADDFAVVMRLRDHANHLHRQLERRPQRQVPGRFGRGDVQHAGQRQLRFGQWGHARVAATFIPSLRVRNSEGLEALQLIIGVLRWPTRAPPVACSYAGFCASTLRIASTCFQRRLEPFEGERARPIAQRRIGVLVHLGEQRVDAGRPPRRARAAPRTFARRPSRLRPPTAAAPSASHRSTPSSPARA